MRRVFRNSVLLASILIGSVSFANAGIILGDVSDPETKNTSCSEPTDDTKVDNGVIVTLTGVIVTFTGVIVTFSNEKSDRQVNCGIILTD